MRPVRFATVLLALIAAPVAGFAAIIGGAYYAPQYDYREFFAATDGKPFQVVLAGNPFPGIDPAIVARDLLPAMQAAKPRPALTFTYDRPSPPPRPDYRLVLVFDPALNLNSDPVCAGDPPALPSRARRAASTSMRSIAGTTGRCRRPRRGPTPPARPIRASNACSASCSRWSSASSRTAGPSTTRCSGSGARHSMALHIRTAGDTPAVRIMRRRFSMELTARFPSPASGRSWCWCGTS